MSHDKTFVGKIFGFRTVLEEGFFNTRGIELFLCECACGTRKYVRKWSLLNGLAQGCMKCPRKKDSNYVGKWKKAVDSAEYIYIPELKLYKKVKT